MRRLTTIAIAGLMACCAGRFARGQAPPPPTKEGIDFFEQKIRPVLVNKCYECHSEEKKKIKGKLRLDDYAAMLKGGESGKPAVVPGDPDKSQLVFSMTYTDKDTDSHDALLMPPPKNGKPRKLPDSVIDDFRQWIKMGALSGQGGRRECRYAGQTLGVCSPKRFTHSAGTKRDMGERRRSITLCSRNWRLRTSTLPTRQINGPLSAGQLTT